MNATLLPEGVKPLSVSELTGKVRGTLESAFASVWVSGEISNLARPASGHVYLSLKDARSQVRAVIYRGVALRLRFDPADGQEVIARGRLSVYEPRGDYQLLIEELQPKGIGAVELALRQLKEKLLKLGYFDPARKRRLPRFPRRIALVTSPTGAAVRDMLEVLVARWPAAEVVIVPVRVQGETAAAEIAQAIGLLNRLHDNGSLPVDVMIVGRGGGSTEDLWAFNERPVADALFQSRIPTVSAVGHEIDVTVADLVADARGLTPSQAAALVTPDLAEMSAGLAELGLRFRDAVTRRLDLARRRLDDLANRAALRRPLERVRDQERRLDELAGRLDRAIQVRLEQSRERLAGTAARLETLSPLNVLSRGYTLTRLESGSTLLRDAAQVQPGDPIVTTLARGSVVSRVETVRSE